MAFYLEKAFFINRAPFEHLELNFKDKGINVLSAINGRGKTTILSHIVDAFYELARPNFKSEFADKSIQYYRVSSPVFNLKMNTPSFVYLRFKKDAETWDYVDIRNKCTEQEYNSQITLNDKIPFSEFSQTLNDSHNIKQWCKLTKKEEVVKLFKNNLLTYFPSYRYEEPGFLNEPYSFKIKHKIESGFSGYLPNRIEVFCQLKELANWMLDVVLDNLQQNQSLNKLSSKLQPLINKPNGKDIFMNELFNSSDPSDVEAIKSIINVISYPQQVVLSNINQVISYSLASKFCNKPLIIGVGERNLGGTRINVSLADNPSDVLYPSIFNMSSGEKALVSVFVELLHQIDNLHIQLTQITGIVLIDEIDKNLHIKMQHDILPKLFAMFPKIQFITSSHSPFLNMGLADTMKGDSQIVDLDNNGIICSPVNTDLYREVYTMMISDNNRFAEKYTQLEIKMQKISKPIIITEGKTDWKHIKAALNYFKQHNVYSDIDVDVWEYEEDMGDSELYRLLESYAKIPNNPHRIIGVFDCDGGNDKNKNNGRKIHECGGIEELGNNVFAISLPIPEYRNYNTNGISIEFLYRDDDLKKVDDSGRRIFVSSEFNCVGLINNGKIVTIGNKNKLKSCGTRDSEKIIDNDVYDSEGHSLALSKDQFAINVLSKTPPFDNMNFDGFQLLANKIREVLLR